MKKIIISSLTIGLLVIICLATNINKTSNLQSDVVSSSESSEGNSSEVKFNAPSKTSIDYSAVAKLKAISRKTEYRIGELMAIDFAMLNTSKETISFVDLSWTRISMKDSDGKDIPVPGHNYGLRAVNFNNLEGGNYDSSCLLYVIGCKDVKEEPKLKSLEDRFNINRFAHWRCIPISRTGNYYITATIENSAGGIEKDYSTKTAVGKLESPPLKITIVE